MPFLRAGGGTEQKQRCSYQANFAHSLLVVFLPISFLPFKPV
jgi:hypothetical protein